MTFGSLFLIRCPIFVSVCLSYFARRNAFYQPKLSLVCSLVNASPNSFHYYLLRPWYPPPLPILATLCLGNKTMKKKAKQTDRQTNIFDLSIHWIVMGSKEKVLYPLPTLKEHRTRGSSEDRNICRVTKLCDEGRLDKTKIKVNSGNILFPVLMKCLELGNIFQDWGGKLLQQRRKRNKWRRVAIIKLMY